MLFSLAPAEGSYVMEVYTPTSVLTQKCRLNFSMDIDFVFANLHNHLRVLDYLWSF